MNLMDTIHLHKKDFRKQNVKSMTTLFKILLPLKQQQLQKLLNYAKFQLLVF